MNIKNIRWAAVFITFAVVLSIFFGVHYLRQKQFIEEPLYQALEGLEEVEAVGLKTKGGRLEIQLSIKKLQDFPLFYQEVEKTVAELYRGEYILTLKNRPEPGVQAAYQRAHLALFEAMAQGNYVAMGRYVEEVGAEYGLETCRMLVTEEHIYLELVKGDGYLYRRFDRQPKGEEAA